MNKLSIVLIIMLLPFYAAMAQNNPEKIKLKSQNLRAEIIKKDAERRERILKKFTDFQNKVKNFAPDINIKLPVSADKADDILEPETSTELQKKKEYYAYAADSYKLRSLPYDTIKEYTADVKRGDRVTVLMKPQVTKNKTYPSLTKDWLLIKIEDGTEGYIPLNLVLNKKPEKDKNAMMMRDYLIMDTPGFESGLAPGARGVNFMTVQYSIGSADSGTKMMKVNTSTLKIRVEPSLDSEVAGSLFKNDIVEVLEYSENEDYYDGKTSKWAKIKKDDTVGWVFGYYLIEVQGDSTSSGAEDLVSQLNKGAGLYVKSDILRVRDAPDDYSTVLFSLQNKDKITVSEIEDEEVTLGGKKSKWVKIKYQEYEGWVFGAFLSKDSKAFEEGDDINNQFQIPINEGEYFVSSKFGKRLLKGKASNHTGIDLAAQCGTDVVAAADGNVITLVENSRNCSSCGYGNYVIIEHKNGYRSVYGHLTKISVKNGQKISSGQKVGTVGNTGHSFGCHLHFEIRAYEEFVDPMNYIHP